MTHVCDRYFRKHGHYPRVVVTSGVQRITVEFSPGYVSISSSHPYQAQVYLTRSAFLALLKKMVPLARRWAQDRARDHDVPAALQEAYWNEMQLLREKRELKKSRVFDLDEEAKRQRQRQRHLRAKERAERKKDASSD